MEPNKKGGGADEEVVVEWGRYQKLVEQLIYLSHTQPSTHVVGVVHHFYAPTKGVSSSSN